MRLRRLDLTRYGKFTGQSIDFGERAEGVADLHIVYGPNEAGKSTAFAAFLDLLFGMERESRYGFLHPYATMRVGGCLELSAGARELVRIKRPNPTLRDAHEDPVPEWLILGDLAGLDRAGYRTMFSLDDESLEAGGESILESKGELGQLLFSASAGLAGLSKQLVELRLEADGFTKPGARSGELQQLKQALAALKQQRDEIDVVASEYSRRAAARDEAGAQYDAALNAQAAAKAELGRVQRFLAALPRWAELRRLRDRSAALGDLPAAPPGWLAELPRLERDENKHRAAAALAAAEVQRLGGEVEAAVVDDCALEFAGRIERLEALRARHVTAELDLPARRGEQARDEGGIAGMLAQLGREDVREPRALLLTAAQSAIFDGLIADRSGIEERLKAATEELAAAVQALTEAERALGGAEGAVSAASMGAVAAAVAAVRASDHAMRLRGAEKSKAQYAGLLARRMLELAPWHGAVEALAGLSVPDAAALEAWGEAGRKSDALIGQLREEGTRLAAALEVAEAELEAIGNVSGLLSDQAVAEIRGAREAAWAEHRRVLDGATAESFEAALRRDDIVCGARLGHEREVAKLHEMARQVAVKRAEVARARAALDEAVEARGRHDGLVRGAIAAVSPALADVTVASLAGWISRREKALEEWGALQQAARDLDAAARDAGLLRDALAAALGQAAVRFDADAGLEILIAVAQAAIDQEAHTLGLRKDVAGCARDIHKRELGVQKASLEDKAWRAAWRDACADCWLGEAACELPLGAVRGMLAVAARLGPALKVLEDLKFRIADMERDQASFRDEVAEFAAAMGMEAGQRSSVDLAQALVARVQDAVRGAESKRLLQAELLGAEAALRTAEGDAREHQRLVSEMMALMQAGSLMELAGKLRDAEDKADLRVRAAQAEGDILVALRMDDLGDAEALLAAASEGELELEQTKLVAQLEGFETRTQVLFSEREKAAERIAAVGGDDAVARIEARRRTNLLEIEDRARTYLRLRVGIAAADRALRAYRDQHRSSMMMQASEAFRVISRGAYRGLGTQPVKERDNLVALGADGSSKMAEDLSKGTRFQLYLALRAAGYHEFAKTRAPVPFIADDIMETFDDFRAEETLKVFEGMARLGQVIYLTHHDHLRALAERMVPGVRVHRLEA